MPASWRSGVSRPAPPITSDNPNNPTLDALFAGPSRSHSPAMSRPSSSTASTPGSSGRSLSSSSSAYSLLSKKMAQMADDEDDRMSIRSGMTVTGRNRQGSVSGNSTVRGRSRAGSVASSVRTTRDWQRGDPLAEEDEIEPMDLDEPTSAEGAGGGTPSASLKGKERAADDSSTTTKRQRLRPSAPPALKPSRPRRISTSVNPGNVSSPALPTLATTTADDLMPSMRYKSSARPASSASSTASASRPKAKSPSVQAQVDRPADISRSSSSSSVASGANPSGQTACSIDTPDASRAAGPPGESAHSQAAPRGWLSLLARPRPSITSLASRDEPDQSSGTIGVKNKPSIDPGEGDSAPMEQDTTPPATPQASRSGHVARPTSQSETATAVPSKQTTPRPDDPPRLSWREWAWSARRPPQHETGESAQQSEPEPVEMASGTKPVSPESGVAVVSTAAPSAVSDQALVSTAEEQQSANSSRSSWLGAWWGAPSATATPAETIAQRKREAWALKLAADRAAGAKAIKAAPDSVPNDAMEEEEAAARIDSIVSQADEGAATAPQPLRKKASDSWNALSRSLAASSASLSGISPSKSILALRVPFTGSGAAASSAASTQSRDSSHANGTAPSSPQLSAQSDQGPVKPLTGSIRTSSARRVNEVFEPAPPVENLVLPTFGDTFLRPPRSFAPKRSTLTRAVSVVSAYLFQRHPAEEAPTSPTLANARQLAGIDNKDLLVEMKNDPAERLPKALEVMGEAPRLDKVKRVVTIGIHGWFTSSNMVKSVLGEQTGTSVKFATMMHDAVHSFLEDRNVGAFNIQAIALEGQGEVEHRVDKLHDQLVARKEWLQAIKMADAVFFATHSQGAVVTTQLIARLLEQELIRGPQTHLLAMCGIAQGPFIYLYQSMALAPYFTYVESTAARELFDFQNPESIAANKFLEALRIMLNAGVKITTIGSLNDQVVPLYSALFSGVSHPSILRAVYIDSDAFRTSDFLANLIVFSIRLRNAGLSDHDLVYHVSEALAGALTGVGHSKIYEEEDVYKLAVRYHFETTHATEAPTHLNTRAAPPVLSMSFNPRDRRNPYLLTWALRGIIEDPQVRELFSNELLALREAYETWRPQTKVLKDVKLKLEGIRMMNWKSGKL